jgi:hypothetical protein
MPLDANKWAEEDRGQRTEKRAIKEGAREKATERNYEEAKG